MAFRFRHQAILNSSSFRGVSCWELTQTPKERSVRELRDFHFREELTSRIVRFQPVFHTREKPMVMRVVASALRWRNRRAK